MKPKRQRKVANILLELVALFCFIFIAFYFLFNSEGIYLWIKYKAIKGREKRDGESKIENVFSDDLESKRKIDLISIPKIKVEAPIIWSTNSDQKVLLEDLRKGVIHYPTSSLPGENGPAVFLGHSSSIPWKRGRFDNVFVLLPELQENDFIYIYYRQKKFVYRVKESKIVNFYKNRLLNDPKIDLYLITCWPPGANFKRVIVEAGLTEIKELP